MNTPGKFTGPLKRIEQRLQKEQKAPDEIVCISNLDPEASEKLKPATEAYFRKFGCYDGLIVVRHNAPEPLPVPTAFRLKNQ